MTRQIPPIPCCRHGQRIVFEVDGSQPYTRDDGQIPDNSKYAEMVASDRHLKLRGYEGLPVPGSATTNSKTHARDLPREFLPALFQRFDVNG